MVRLWGPTALNHFKHCYAFYVVLPCTWVICLIDIASTLFHIVIFIYRGVCVIDNVCMYIYMLVFFYFGSFVPSHFMNLLHQWLVRLLHYTRIDPKQVQQTKKLAPHSSFCGTLWKILRDRAFVFAKWLHDHFEDAGEMQILDLTEKPLTQFFTSPSNP